MNIQDFTELTSFVYSEFEKISESCGLNTVPEKSLNYTIHTIDKYVKLYNRTLFNREKRQLKLDEALLTRPHNWLWKVFHSKLWKQIQLIEKEDKAENKQEPKGRQDSPTSTALTVFEVNTPQVYIPLETDN